MNDMTSIRGMGDGEAIPASFVAHIVTASLPHRDFSLHKGACGITITTAESPGVVWRFFLGCLCLDDNHTRALAIGWLLELPGVREVLVHFPTEGNFERFIEDPLGYARVGSVKGAVVYRKLLEPYDKHQFQLLGKDESLAGIALCEQAKLDADQHATPLIMDHEGRYGPKDPPRIVFVRPLPNMHLDPVFGLIS
jgi:hypothetical protein